MSNAKESQHSPWQRTTLIAPLTPRKLRGTHDKIILFIRLIFAYAQVAKVKKEVQIEGEPSNIATRSWKYTSKIKKNALKTRYIIISHAH